MINEHLKIESLKKNFESLTVYDGLDLSIREGEFVTIYGPSGCGKTTLLKLLSTLEEPTEGNIYFDGKSIFENPEEYKSNTAFVWQSPRLAHWRTAGENIELALELRDPEMQEDTIAKRTQKSLEFVEMAEFGDQLPQYLSGGMKQRVNLARALALDSDIVFMDEPLTGLNELAEKRRLKENIIEMHETTDRTILYVTHSIDDAVTMSDRIIILSSRPTSVMDTYLVDSEKTYEIENEAQLELKKKITERVRAEIS
jgi:NitT/TauT family transport system ATP-binding protein